MVGLERSLRNKTAPTFRVSPDGLHPATDIVLKEIEFDGETFVCPTWEQMGEYTFDLARQIIESGQSFDRVVALAKGGWTWARTLLDYLQIDELSSMRIKRYIGINEAEEPVITQPLADAIGGESILLFDEVIDSGKTIDKGLEILKAMGAKNVRTAGLCYKPRSSVVPDFFAFSSSAWVVFPHEVREFVEGSARKWRLGSEEEGRPGISDIEILDRLITIGLPRNQVEFFLHRI